MVTPLDLQTNFSHVGTIGRHVSAENESQVIRQDVISGHIMKENEKIKDDQNRRRHNGSSDDEDDEQSEEPRTAAAPKKKTVHRIENPNEGTNIDIMC